MSHLWKLPRKSLARPIQATLGTAILCLISILFAYSSAIHAEIKYDVVLAGGRVIDPETGMDAVRSVGISGNRIARISAGELEGHKVVDVSDLVVAPGFINVHSHAWTPLGQEFEVLDGVTTALELEAGAFPAASFGTHEPIAIADKSRINFGASVGHAFARSKVLDGKNAVSGADDMTARQVGTALSIDMEISMFRATLDGSQIRELERLLRNELKQGVGLGIGMLLDYMSEAVSDAEMEVLFQIAADTGAPIFVHIRRGVAGDPAGLEEVIDYARKTGAQVHICHLQASAMGGVKRFLHLIRSARAEGIRISTESFPYNAGSTSNTAAVFNRNWQEIFAISYGDVEIASTGERFTKDSWEHYRESAPGTTVIHHYNKEEWTSIATNAPDVMVASDGTPVISLKANVAPFGIGTNARILGRYVRERQSLTLIQAIRKMTLLPADMLSTYNPAFRQKGRLQEGMDADITVFDPNNVIDRATYREPFQHSEGFMQVLVGGQFVVKDGILLPDAYPGVRVDRGLE